MGGLSAEERCRGQGAASAGVKRKGIASRIKAEQTVCTLSLVRHNIGKSKRTSFISCAFFRYLRAMGEVQGTGCERQRLERHF